MGEPEPQQRFRILVVEDEPAIARGICDVLAFHGHEPGCAGDGESGLREGLHGAHDLVVLEISPEPYVEPGSDPSDLIALRLWRLQRGELRSRFERLGVSVSTLRPETSLEEALEEVRAYRRHARLALR